MIKQKTGKNLEYNSQSRPWKQRQGKYTPKTTVYQKYMDNHQEHQDQDHETGPIDTIEILFADQDLQFITDKRYKEHK